MFIHVLTKPKAIILENSALFVENFRKVIAKIHQQEFQIPGLCFNRKGVGS